MAHIVLIGSPDPSTAALAAALRARLDGDTLAVETGGTADLVDRLADAEAPSFDIAIYCAASRGDGDRPDRDDAQRLLTACATSGIGHVVVIASAAIIVPSHRHPGLAKETPGGGAAPRRDNRIASAWRAFEATVDKVASGRDRINTTVLRPTALPVAGGRDLWSRLLASKRRFAAVPAGFDPTIQLLAIEDLAAAVVRTLASSVPLGHPPERYHVAPAAAVPLASALRLAGIRRLPIPARVLRLVWRLRSRSPDAVGYLCHSWTVSGTKAERVLDFVAVGSSAATAHALRRAKHGSETASFDQAAPNTASPPATTPGTSPPEPSRAGAHPPFDDFGEDESFLRFIERTVGGFLHDRYWRIELAGLEHVPRQGRAVLVGVHRGFMPFDGVMAVIAMRRTVGRTPRFLIHPGLIKFPFLAPAMIKLGGILANRPNADHVLSRDRMLGIFPEGVGGAFSLYRDAYRLKPFGRDEFVKMALANGAPLVPFVTVGSAEIFPILKKLRWHWWQRRTEWPCFPITPTFPLLPVPLPSKWHTRFLDPIDVGARYGPEAADDPSVVRALGDEVRQRMTDAMVEMLAARRSIFFGNIFPAMARNAPGPRG